MRRRVKLVLALMAAPALLAGGIALALAGATLPVKSVAEVLPDDVVAFARLSGINDRWGAMQQTQAWKDIQRSRLVQTMVQMGAFDEMTGTFAERAERLGLEPTLETYMQFIGHDLGVGLRLDRETGEPSFIMTYRIDTPALMQTLAVENPGALAGLLTERYFGEDGPQAGEYGGFQIYSLGDRGFYTLLRDIFVTSNSRATIERTIDHANAAGAGSLGQSEAYTAEMAKLPGSTLLSAYVDVERVRSKELLQSMLGPDFTGAGLDALDRSMKRFPAVAFGIDAPSSDLYAASLTSSRTAADVLTDSSSPPLHAVVPTDGAIYAELGDMRTMARQFMGSELYARMQRAPFMKDLERFMNRPELIEETFDVKLDLPPMPEGMEVDTQFERTVITRALKGALALISPGAMALNVGAPDPTGAKPPIPSWLKEHLAPTGIAMAEHGGDENVPPIAMAMKLPPIAQVAEALLVAVMAEISTADPQGAEAFTREAGGRNVVVMMDRSYSWDEETDELTVSMKPVAGFVRMGDTMILSTDYVHIEKLAAEDLSEVTTADPFADVPAGYFTLMKFDYEKFAAMMTATGANPREVEQMQALMGSFGGSTATQASYVRDGFLTWEQLSWATYQDDPGALMRGMLEQPAEPFGAWKLLPADTTLQLSWRMEAEGVMEMVRSIMPEREQADMTEALAEIKEMIGVDVEAELLPALGSDMTLSIAPQALGEDAMEGAIPVPAFTMTWSLDNPEIVAGAIGNLVDRAIAPKLPPDASAEDRAQVPHHMMVEEGGVTIHMVEPPAASGAIEQTGGTLMPGYAIIDGTLVVSSSGDALRGAAAQSQTIGDSYATSAGRQRAAAAVGGDASMTFYHVDLAGLMKMVDGYAPIIAQAIPAPEPMGLERPEWPGPEGDMDAFQKEFEAYQRKLQEHRQQQAEKTAARVHEVCETVAGWVDFVAGSAQAEGNTLKGRVVLKLR
jgi:hypothetical protein